MAIPVVLERISALVADISRAIESYEGDETMLHAIVYRIEQLTTHIVRLGDILAQGTAEVLLNALISSKNLLQEVIERHATS